MPRRVSFTTRFKKDRKRELRTDPHLDNDLRSIVYTLQHDLKLHAKHRDHALAGHWKGHRDCHVKPDLVLIYRKEDEPERVVTLVRLGSHAELF
jgi:mRNA interferase YafQ